MPQTLDRRHFLKTSLAAGAALPLAACNPKDVEKTNADVPKKVAGENIFEILGKHRFLGQDGQEININALKAKLANQWTTLSFGFTDCTNSCKYLNPALGDLGRALEGGITSIMVNTNPVVEGSNQASRDGYAAFIRGKTVEHPVIYLYPLSGDGFDLSSEAEKSIEIDDLHAKTNANDAKVHTDIVRLCSPGGEVATSERSFSVGPDLVSKWAPVIAAGSKGHISR